MYITWKYDQFPYLLCGKVDSGSLTDGWYGVEGYGTMRFKPQSIIRSNKKGEAIKKKIEDLQEQRRMVIETLERGWKQELTSLINNSI